MKLGVTQNMIDKLIQDEIYLFIKKLFFHKTHHVKDQFNPKRKKRKIELIGKEEIKIVRKKILQKKKPLQPLKIVPPPQAPLTPSSELSNAHVSFNKDNSNHSTGLLTTANQYFTSATLEETRVSKLSDQQTPSNKLSACRPKNKKLSKDKFKKVRNIFSSSFDSQPPAKKKSYNKYCSVADVSNTSQNLQHVQTGLLSSSSSTGQIQVQGSSFYYLQTQGSLPKNSIESSASVFPNSKSQLVSSGSGKQTIVVHPISRFVINQPTVSSFSTMNSLPNQVTECDSIKDNIINCTEDKRNSISTSASSNCESQASLLHSFQSSRGVPTTSLLTELSSNDLRYFTNLILKQKKQAISSSNSSIFVPTPAKCSTYTAISLGASSTTSSLMFDGVKYLSSTSLSNSHSLQNPFKSFESLNEKVSVFKNVQGNLHPPISQCNLNIRPTAAPKKNRVTSPYYSGVCGNSTNGSFTLTYNPQYKNSKSSSISNGVKISVTSPTSSSTPSVFCSQQKSENSVTTVVTKFSSSNTSISDIPELSRQKSTNFISCSSTDIKVSGSCNFTDIKGSGSFMKDRKKKNQFINKNSSSIVESNELAAKPSHLSDIKSQLDSCFFNNRFAVSETAISEQRAIEEQQRMYSLLQTFLKQSDVCQSQYMDITRTDNLNLLNKVGSPTVAESAKGDCFYDSIRTHLDDTFASRTESGVSKELNQSSANGVLKTDKKDYSTLSVDSIYNESVMRQQFFPDTSNSFFSKHKMLNTNGQEILANLNSSCSSYLAKNSVPVTTALLNNSLGNDKGVNSTVIGNSEKSQIIEDVINILHEYPQKIRCSTSEILSGSNETPGSNEILSGSNEILSDSNETLSGSNKKCSEKLIDDPQHQSKNEIFNASKAKNDQDAINVAFFSSKMETEIKYNVTDNPLMSSDISREGISKEMVSTELGDYKTANTHGRNKLTTKNECFSELNDPDTSYITRSGWVSKDFCAVDKIPGSSILKFDDIFNKPEESSLMLTDAPSIAEDTIQRILNEKTIPINRYSLQLDDISSDQMPFRAPLHEKPVDLMFKAVTENGGTNGSLKEFISAESQSFFMTDSIANLKNTLHSMNNLKDNCLLFTDPAMSYLLKSDSFDNPDCSKKDIF